MGIQAARMVKELTGAVGFEPEVVLPTEFSGRSELDASLQPEKRLMLAVLGDAVGTFQKYVSATNLRGRRLFSEAEEWFEAREHDRTFGFEHVCEALGLEPAFIRTGLRRWRERQVARPTRSAIVVSFAFRRVNGRRHSITGRPVGFHRSA